MMATPTPNLATAARAMRLPRLHPDDELLLAYAGGSLGEVKSVLVATHLAACPACRTRVEAFEAICGDWLSTLPTGADRQTALEPMLDAILNGAVDLAPVVAPPPEPPPAGSLAARVAAPLRHWRGFVDAEQAWEEIAPGVALSSWAVEAGGTSATLLRMAPGAPVPAHRHTATEMLLVLTGRFSDDQGDHDLGDVIIYEPPSEHHAVGAGEEDCICLFLLDGPLEFLDAQ